jgi:muramidase (phage lysozyme)
MRSTQAVVMGMTALLLSSGCAAGGPEGPEEDVEAVGTEVVAQTCAPSLADGAVPPSQRAMLDTIAYTEGTVGSCGQDGYNTGFAFHCFRSCDQHPNTVWKAGGYSSSAAGRYQFLSATWRGLGLGSLSPQHQDLGAVKLIARRGVDLPTKRALTATEFANAMKKMSYEWASLPYSPYGQPRKSLAQARARYCEKAGC